MEASKFRLLEDGMNNKQKSCTSSGGEPWPPSGKSDWADCNNHGTSSICMPHSAVNGLMVWHSMALGAVTRLSLVSQKVAW